MPNMYSTPCCLRLRAISVAPSIWAMAVLLSIRIAVRRVF
jgi:hypothetical protein